MRAQNLEGKDAVKRWGENIRKVYAKPFRDHK